jgi:hypothetical protein
LRRHDERHLRAGHVAVIQIADGKRSGIGLFKRGNLETGKPTGFDVGKHLIKRFLRTPADQKLRRWTIVRKRGLFVGRKKLLPDLPDAFGTVFDVDARLRFVRKDDRSKILRMREADQIRFVRKIRSALFGIGNLYDASQQSLEQQTAGQLLFAPRIGMDRFQLRLERRIVQKLQQRRLVFRNVPDAYWVDEYSWSSGIVNSI